MDFELLPGAFPEIAELTDSVPWKWWAIRNSTSKTPGWKWRTCFTSLSLAQVLGMSAQDIYQAYRQKHQVNLQRQDGGYTTKDEDDSRHIGV